MTVPIDPDCSLVQREALGDIDAHSTMLSSAQRVEALFPEPHSQVNLHIVVQIVPSSASGEYYWLIVMYDQN